MKQSNYMILQHLCKQNASMAKLFSKIEDTHYINIQEVKWVLCSNYKYWPTIKNPLRRRNKWCQRSFEWIKGYDKNTAFLQYSSKIYVAKHWYYGKICVSLSVLRWSSGLIKWANDTEDLEDWN